MRIRAPCSQSWLPHRSNDRCATGRNGVSAIHYSGCGLGLPALQTMMHLISVVEVEAERLPATTTAMRERIHGTVWLAGQWL